MSLNTVINITKGWPNPYIVEDSLPDSGSGLGQGDVVRINSDRKWVKGITSVNQTPYIINVDSTDPSTGREAHKAGYVQVPWGNIHGISLTNALEIETANYKADDVYEVGSPLSAPAGLVKLAATGEVVIGTVVRTPYQLGAFTYLTFLAEDGKRVEGGTPGPTGPTGPQGPTGA
jgi:hypothetical protein